MNSQIVVSNPNFVNLNTELTSNDLKQVEHCGGLNGALYDSGQTGLHKTRSDVKSGRRIIKSSIVNNIEMVNILKEDKNMLK